MRRSALASVFLVALLGAAGLAGWRGGVQGTAVAPGSIRAPFSGIDAARLMDDLISSPVAARYALKTIVTAHDPRFIAPLIEAMRASQVGVLTNVDDTAVINALETLSGKRFGDDWPMWSEWYGATALVPPPGFTGWKGRLFERLDPHFREFLSDAAPSRIRVEEIQWGGVAVDGIPALTHPKMIPAASATYLMPEEPVFALSVNGYARAYPLRILDWHEMVNDRIGGVPVSLAYCTLCGAGIAYDGRASNGVTYTFGSSGLLFRSNKLMYDRETRTLWNQLTGEPVLGKLARTGVRLMLRPLVLTSWGEWLAEHPETKVLDAHTGYERTYAPGTPYARYFASSGTMFPVWRRSRVLPLKARIYALRIAGTPKAFPADLLAARRVVNDAVGGTSVVLIAKHRAVTVNRQQQGGPLDRFRGAPAAYSAGVEVRAFRRGSERFQPGPDPDVVLDGSGRPWRVTEATLIGPGGISAPRVPGFLAYWFAWYAFFPQTLVYHP